MKDEFIIQDLNGVDPSPIAPRKCKCGCGHTLQPNKDNHVFINKQHTDYYYYHKVKKPKLKKQNEVTKMHQKNDRICDWYFNESPNDPAVWDLKRLVDEGFNPGICHGTAKEDGIEFALTYNFMFRLENLEGRQVIKIKKQ